MDRDITFDWHWQSASLQQAINRNWILLNLTVTGIYQTIVKCDVHV